MQGSGLDLTFVLGLIRLFCGHPSVKTNLGFCQELMIIICNVIDSFLSASGVADCDWPQTLADGLEREFKQKNSFVVQMVSECVAEEKSVFLSSKSGLTIALSDIDIWR